MSILLFLAHHAGVDVAYLALLTEVFLLLNIITTEAKETFPLEAYLQIVPFKTILFYLQNMTNIHIAIQFFGNLLLLMPFAAYINLHRNISTLKNVSFALWISVAIEISQGAINVLFQYPNNISDIGDVLLNMLRYTLALSVAPWFKEKYKIIYR